MYKQTLLLLIVSMLLVGCKTTDPNSYSLLEPWVFNGPPRQLTTVPVEYINFDSLSIWVEPDDHVKVIIHDGSSYNFMIETIEPEIISGDKHGTVIKIPYSIIDQLIVIDDRLSDSQKAALGLGAVGITAAFIYLLAAYN